MKIRYLINNAYASGGTVRTTLNMANALSARGHDVEIVSLRRLVAEPLYPVGPGVRLRPLVDQYRPVPRAVAVARATMTDRPSRLLHPEDSRYDTYSLYSDVQLLRFLRSVRDGVLIGTRPALNLAIARHARSSVVRIAQEHVNLTRRTPGLRTAIEQGYPRLDAVVALTTSDARAYQRLLGAGPRVVAIPNAAPEQPGDPAPLDSKVVVAAGRLTAAKGFGLLIKAFARVVARHPDWQLRIFGAGDKEAALQERITALGLDNHVRLMGYTTQLADELRSASIYALSSRFEGFPMVLLEAMMCGLPPVAFDCPTGPADIIDHGTDGLVVKHLSTRALAAGIIELIEDPERRTAMGAAALAKARQYATPVIAQRWEELFTDLAATRGHDAAIVGGSNGSPDPRG